MSLLVMRCSAELGVGSHGRQLALACNHLVTAGIATNAYVAFLHVVSYSSYLAALQRQYQESPIRAETQLWT